MLKYSVCAEAILAAVFNLQLHSNLKINKKNKEFILLVPNYKQRPERPDLSGSFFSVMGAHSERALNMET